MAPCSVQNDDPRETFHTGCQGASENSHSKRFYAPSPSPICPLSSDCAYSAHQGLHSTPDVSNENCPNFLTNLLFGVQLMECVHGPGKVKGEEGTPGLDSHENKKKVVSDWLLLKYDILLILNEHYGITSQVACDIFISTWVSKRY